MTMKEGTRLKVLQNRTTRNKLEQFSVKLGEIAGNFNKLQQRHGCCVRSIDCECYICIGSAGCCVCSIDCECGICDPTSPRSEGLNYYQTELNRSSDFHVLDDPQVKLDSLVLGCTRELDLPSVYSNTWLERVEFKAIKVASYLFDKMSERDHVQVVHVFIKIRSKFSLVLVGNGLIAHVWDPGIGLTAVKLVGHTINVRELLMDMTSVFCLHRFSDNINRERGTGWQWFMHSPVVDINSIRSVTIIPTYNHGYNGIRGLSLHVTTSSRKDIMLVWGSILQLTLHDDSKKVTTIDLSVQNWSVDGCTIRKAFQRRGSAMASSLSTARARGSLEKLYVCGLCQPRLFDFILLVAMYSGAFNICSRLEDGKTTWLHITQKVLLVNWSTKTEVKLVIFSLDTFWKVEFARSLITTSRVEVVGIVFYATITRARFGELCMSMLLRSRELVGKCLSDAKIDNIQIHEGVLVGRLTRIPKVQQLLKDRFDEKKLYTSINLDEDMSHGAAVLYAIRIRIGKGDENVQELLVVDVILIDLGLEMGGGMIIVLISRNATISNTNGSASLRYGAAIVRTMVYDLSFTFDPGGIVIGLENKVVGLHFKKMQHSNILHQHTCIFTGSFLKKCCYFRDFNAALIILHQFPFDPGKSFLRKFCYLSDSRAPLMSYTK